MITAYTVAVTVVTVTAVVVVVVGVVRETTTTTTTRWFNKRARVLKRSHQALDRGDCYCKLTSKRRSNVDETGRVGVRVRVVPVGLGRALEEDRYTGP